MAITATETLSERITRQLVESILLGRYRPGELLPTEDELCQQFGVSRPVVREAAKALSMLGMIRSRQGRGTEVLAYESWNELAPEILRARRDLDLAEDFLVDLLVVRRTVEVEAASLAAEHATPADLGAMARFLEEGEEAGDDVEAFARVDVAFHDAILAATGNRPLRSLLHMIEPTLLAARIASLTSRPDSTRRSLREHRAIYRAINAGSPDDAKEAMATHLSWTANLSPDQLAGRGRRA
jgi:GntR family transcriptional repressor for pyruvate dehydrogenase complex